MEHNCIKFIGTLIILISKLFLVLLEIRLQPWAGLLSNWAKQQQELSHSLLFSGPAEMITGMGLSLTSAAVSLCISPSLSTVLFPTLSFNHERQTFILTLSVFDVVKVSFCWVWQIPQAQSIHILKQSGRLIKKFLTSFELIQVQQLGKCLEQHCYKERKHVFVFFFQCLISSRCYKIIFIVTFNTHNFL